MARFGVTVHGAKRLRASMRAAGLDLKELTKINREAATVVAGAAKARAPVGKPSRKRGRGRRKTGGALARSIRPGATSKAAVIRAGGARVPYANVQHWGWPKRNIQPKYFISDAAIETEPIWVTAYERHIRRVIRQVRGANR